MTFPAATFTAIAPPADGLSLAFTSARRRRNSKAAVSAFGGAVAIASALSFLAPPGQALVQEPAPPAHGGLLTGLPDAPRHGAPAPLVRTPTTATIATSFATGMRSVQLTRSAHIPSSAGTRAHTCASSRSLACLDIRTTAPAGPRMHGSVCPSAASITVEYDAPPVGPTRMSISRTVEVGSCST